MKRDLDQKPSGSRRDAMVLALSGAVQVLVIVGVAMAMTGCELPPTETKQGGFRGTGMVDVQSPETLQAKAAATVVPVALPAVPSAGGPTAGEVYQNVKVLGGVPVGDFTRLMVAMTNWVSPKEGCAYCHDPANMASDEKYAKVVSRRMIEMTQHVNAGWKSHVADTGVTCYTCHRGNPVPEQIWFTGTDDTKSKFAGNRAGQNAVSMEVALASLPVDPFTSFFEKAESIRVEGTPGLPHGNQSSIKQAEWTYGLMMHFSQSLGVNCTYCHNSRQFASWEESPPTRAQAWHGIQMVRDLNVDYLVPLRDVFPAHRRGPSGDAPKVYCATCHQGVNKPLGGAKMVGDYAALSAPVAAPSPAPAAATEATPAVEAPVTEAAPPAEAEAEAPASGIAQ